jgi:pleiotropic regulator 1
MASADPEQLVRSSTKRTREIFAADFATPAALEHARSDFTIKSSWTAPRDLAEQTRVASRIRTEYEAVRELPPALAAKMASAASTAAERRNRIKSANAGEQSSDPKMRKMIESASDKADQAKDARSMALTLRTGGNGTAPNAKGPTPMRNTPSSALVRKDTFKESRPEWHRPWKLMRVLAGSNGWVRSLAVDPDNNFFVSGSGDRTIKLWNLATGELRLTLTGHMYVPLHTLRLRFYATNILILTVEVLYAGWQSRLGIPIYSPAEKTRWSNVGILRPTRLFDITTDIFLVFIVCKYLLAETVTALEL